MAVTFPNPMSRAQVKTLLQESEGQPSPRRGTSHGHSGSRHVSISNQGLRERNIKTREQALAEKRRRQEARKRGKPIPTPIEIVTSFIQFDDQIDVATALLNHPIAQTARDYFTDNMGERRVSIEAVVPTTKVRCSSGGRNWTQPLNTATIVLDRGAGGKLHIVTCYATLELSKGRPRCICN